MRRVQKRYTQAYFAPASTQKAEQRFKAWFGIVRAATAAAVDLQQNKSEDAAPFVERFSDLVTKAIIWKLDCPADQSKDFAVSSKALNDDIKPRLSEAAAAAQGLRALGIDPGGKLRTFVEQWNALSDGVPSASKSSRPVPVMKAASQHAPAP